MDRMVGWKWDLKCGENTRGEEDRLGRCKLYERQIRTTLSINNCNVVKNQYRAYN